MGLMRFRVWHKDDKVMLSNHLGFMITDTGQLLIESMLGDEETMEKVELDNYIVMQYTGLKDKNGVEICEGDVVEYQGRANKHPFGGRWENVISGVGEIRYELTGYFICEPELEDCIQIDLSQLLFRYDEYDIEVLGNIYENPELSEEK